MRVRDFVCDNTAVQLCVCVVWSRSALRLKADAQVHDQCTTSARLVHAQCRSSLTENLRCDGTAEFRCLPVGRSAVRSSPAFVIEVSTPQDHYERKPSMKPVLKLPAQGSPVARYACIFSEPRLRSLTSNDPAAFMSIAELSRFSILSQ